MTTYENLVFLKTNIPDDSKIFTTMDTFDGTIFYESTESFYMGAQLDFTLQLDPRELRTFLDKLEQVHLFRFLFTNQALFNYPVDHKGFIQLSDIIIPVSLHYQSDGFGISTNAPEIQELRKYADRVYCISQSECDVDTSFIIDEPWKRMYLYILF